MCLKTSIDSPTYNKTYKELLRFAGTLEVDEAALLKQQSTKRSKKKEIVATDVRPAQSCYYHPRIGNRPWIDRLFVAWHPQKECECLVIIEDNVNSSQFSEACTKLQTAADLLSNAHNIPYVLLIVNVIGATESTTTTAPQRHLTLTWPHVLVRSDTEVRQFYSTNFADIVLYARHRLLHLLSSS